MKGELDCFKSKSAHEALTRLWILQMNDMEGDWEKVYMILLAHSSTKYLGPEIPYKCVKLPMYGGYISPPTLGNKRAEVIVEEQHMTKTKLKFPDAVKLAGESNENLVYSARYGSQTSKLYVKYAQNSKHMMGRPTDAVEDHISWFLAVEKLPCPAFMSDQPTVTHLSMMAKAVREELGIIPPSMNVFEPFLHADQFGFSFQLKEGVDGNVFAVAKCGVYYEKGVMTDARLWVLHSVLMTFNWVEAGEKKTSTHYVPVNFADSNLNVAFSTGEGLDPIFKEPDLLSGRFVASDCFGDRKFIPVKWNATAEFVYLNQSDAKSAEDLVFDLEELKKKYEFPFNYMILCDGAEGPKK